MRPAGLRGSGHGGPRALTATPRSGEVAAAHAWKRPVAAGVRHRSAKVRHRSAAERANDIPCHRAEAADDINAEKGARQRCPKRHREHCTKEPTISRRSGACSMRAIREGPVAHALCHELSRRIARHLRQQIEPDQPHARFRERSHADACTGSSPAEKRGPVDRRNPSARTDERIPRHSRHLVRIRRVVDEAELRAAPSPGADVAGVSAVPVQMWQG